MSRFPRAFELSDPPRYDQRPSEALAERAAAAGVTVIDLAYDIVSAGGIVYVPISNYVDGDLRAAHEMLVHPRTVPGLSDGGAHCTMIADFDYPTFLLGYWGRDAPADLRLPVEAVVKQQCADTAALVGLHDRGVLAPGKRADVNLIALSEVGSTFPTIVDDLPGGGSRLAQPGHRLRHHHRRRGGRLRGRGPQRHDGGSSGTRRSAVSAVVTGGRTLVDKIWDQHVVTELGDGLDVLHVDRHLVHDVTSPKAFTTLAERHVEVLSPELTFGSPEHSVTILAGRTEADNELSRKFVPLMRRNFATHGLRLFDIDSPDHGIVHVIGPELGLTLPGATVVCGDSHTCTNGGLGALGFGVGTSELTLVLATQTLVQRRPKMMRITFAHALAPGVEPKDLMLDAITRLGADAGAGYAIEFAGPAIVALGVEQRMTVCNLAVELGAKIGLVAPDDVTFDYVATRRFAPKGATLDAAVAHWRDLASDPGRALRPRGGARRGGGGAAGDLGDEPGAQHGRRCPDPRPRRRTGREHGAPVGAGARLHGPPTRPRPRGTSRRLGLHRLVHQRSALGSAKRRRRWHGAGECPPTCGPWSCPAPVP